MEKKGMQLSFLAFAKQAQEQQKLKESHEQQQQQQQPQQQPQISQEQQQPPKKEQKPSRSDSEIYTSGKNKVKFSDSNDNGFVNQIFEDSFASMDTPTAVKRNRMSITRMGTYTKLNRNDTLDESVSSNESVIYHQKRRPSVFARINSVEKRTALKSALRTRFKKIAEERLTIKQIFARYVEASTLHGFRYTCTDTFLIRRIIWAILMILGAIYFIIKLKEGIIEYFEFPFSTLSTVDFAASLIFPAISICPINNLKIQNLKNNSKLNRLLEEDRIPLHRNWTDPHFDINGDELYNITYDSSWKINEIFEDCDWVKRDTNHPAMRPNTCGPQNFTEYFNINGQLCYTVNSGNYDRNLLKVTQSGILHGYEFMFDMRVYESYNSEHHTGLYVVIHDQKSPPNMEQGFSVSPGFKTFVALDVTETTNLPSPYGTHCGEKKLKYFDEYSQKACLLEHLTDHATSACQCREPFMPDSGYPLCSLRQSILCMLPAKESFNEYEERQHCPIDCNVTTYSARLSDARYIHDPPKGIEPILMQREAWGRGKEDTHLMKLVNEMNNKQLDKYVQDNIIMVLFYFREMEKSIAEQEATFDFYQFLGDMGGEIGLMLGASLLTFVEFLDLFWFLAYHQLLRFHKAHRKPKDEGSVGEDVIADI